MEPTVIISAALGSVWTTVGWVALWIAVGLLSLLALLVLLPTHLDASGGVDELSLSGQVRVRWAWGILGLVFTPGEGVVLRLFGLRCWTFRGDDSEPKPKKPKKRKARARGQLQWLLRYRQAGLRLLRRLLTTLRLQLRLQGELGLGDPAATALVHQLLWELDRLSEPVQLASVELRVTPDWLDERVQLDGSLQARLWPAHIGLVLLAALLNRETRQMIRTVPRAGR